MLLIRKASRRGFLSDSDAVTQTRMQNAGPMLLRPPPASPSMATVKTLDNSDRTRPCAVLVHARGPVPHWPGPGWTRDQPMRFEVSFQSLAVQLKLTIEKTI